MVADASSGSDLEPHYRMVPPEKLPELPRNSVHVVVDNLRSAFNVGSIFRTADAGAAAHLHLCGMTAYPPHLKLAKTALGAIDYVPWTHYAETLEAIDALQADNVPCIAVEADDGASNYLDFDWPKPVAIVFGNEVRGVSPEVLERCDAHVRIPMQGFKNTINVATAFGIVFFEVLRHQGALNR